MLLENKKAIQLGIKKSLGILKKLETMVDQDQYCADIAQQVNAAI
jgi:DNA-binding FrmR family transcriptional regulator